MTVPDSSGPYPDPNLDGAKDPSDLSRPLYGAGFGAAVKRFFAKYADFSGRASRSEYWWMVVFNWIAGLIPAVILSVGLTTALSSARSYRGQIVFVETPDWTMAIIGIVLTVVVSLGLLVPTLAVLWRRLHDAGYSGAMALLTLIPGVGGLIVLILTLMPAKPEGRSFDRPAVG